MSSKRTGQNSLPCSNGREIRASSDDDDIILIDLDDSSDDLLLPDISVTQKKANPHEGYKPLPKTQSGLTSDRATSFKSTGILSTPTGRDISSGSPRKALLGPRSSLSAQSASKHSPNSLRLETGRGEKKKLHHMPSSPTSLCSSSQPLFPPSGRSDPGKKANSCGEPHHFSLESHCTRKSLDCLDLFSPSPTARPGDRHKHYDSEARFVHMRDDSFGSSSRRDLSASLVRAKIRERKRSRDYDSRSVTAGKTKEQRSLPSSTALAPSVAKSASSHSSSVHRNGSLASKEKQSFLSGGTKYGSRDEGTIRLPPVDTDSLRHSLHVPVPPQQGALKHLKNPLPSLKATSRSVSPPKSKKMVSKSPSATSQPTSSSSSAPKIITLKHLQSDYSNPSVESSPNRDCETESSSIFDFNESDLFEVLDSVESESICSAYNPSDNESPGVIKQAAEPSKLVRSVSCKSPSESRMKDFTKSFIKKKRKRPQVAKKSTALNGVRFYKHPVRGWGLVRMERYCTVELARLPSSIVRKARKDGVKYVQAKLAAEKAQLTSKKRENKSKDVSSSLAKRPKLSSDSPATKLVSIPSEGTQSTPSIPTPATAELSQSVTNPLKPAALKSKQKKKEAYSVVSKGTPVVQKPKSAGGTSAEKVKQKPGSKNLPLPNKQFEPKPSAQQLVFCRPLPLILKRSKKFQSISFDGSACKPALASPQSAENGVTPDASADELSRMQGEKSKLGEISVSSQTVVPSEAPTLDENAEKPTELPSEEPSSGSATILSVAVQASKSEAAQQAFPAGEKSPETPHTSEDPQRLEEDTALAPSAVEPTVSTSLAAEEGQIASTSTPPAEEPSLSQTGSGKQSERDVAYDLCLLETIAKFAPESDTATATACNKQSTSGTQDMDMGTDGTMESPLFTIKLPLTQLRRVPSAPSGVTTTPAGMFRDVSVQADRGMIIDKEVLDNYLVVKLHEAMFDMKAQLQLMEAQVASIAKQKESLERTLQAKTQYIREMTTTGFKPVLVDKAVNTDPISSDSFDPPSLVQVKSRSRKSVKVCEIGVQTRPKVSTVSTQTTGFVRSVPSRLQGLSGPVCLYNHPERELQLFIEQRNSAALYTSNAGGEDGTEPTHSTSQHRKWLHSVPVEGECSRSVGISPSVRFMRAMQSSAYPQASRTSIDSLEESSTTGKCELSLELVAMECIPQSWHASISKLSDLYFKLKAIPKEPVQERHMVSLVGSLHHLLSHLPDEVTKLSSPVSPSKTSPERRDSSSAPLTPPQVATPTTGTPSTPTSAGIPASSSPPSTPGAASWAMGAKIQALINALQGLEEKGRATLPKFFKAELVQLQNKAQDTLKFLTVGLRHETFSHDKAGCIVTSDIQLRPWRDRELKLNPYFHRMCVDVGLRRLLDEFKRLMARNEKGKRLGQQSSDEDSDIELLCTSSPPLAKRTATKVSAGSRVRKRRAVVKATGKRFRKSATSKSERINQLVKEKAAGKDNHNSTIPASPDHTELNPEPPGSNQSAQKLIKHSLPVTAVSSSVPPSSTTLVSSPMTCTSPSQQPSPFHKLVSKGESFQVKLAELQSSVNFASQSVSSSEQPKSLTLSDADSTSTDPSSDISARNSSPVSSKRVLSPIASIPSNIDALGGNVSAQVSVAMCIKQATYAFAKLAASTTSGTSTAAGPLSVMSPAVTVQSVPNLSVSNTSTSSIDSGGARSQQLPRLAVQGALKTLFSILPKTLISLPLKQALLMQLARAHKLAQSSYAIDLHMAQMLINQVIQYLSAHLPSTWMCPTNAVIAQPLGHIPNAHPTRSSFSASPQIVTPIVLPNLSTPGFSPLSTSANLVSTSIQSTVQTSSVSTVSVVSSVMSSTISMSAHSSMNENTIPSSRSAVLHTHLPVPVLSAAKPTTDNPVPRVATTVDTALCTPTQVVDTSVHIAGTTVQVIHEKQQPDSSKGTTARATMSTVTSTTPACGSVRMSASVTTAAVSQAPVLTHLSTSAPSVVSTCAGAPLISSVSFAPSVTSVTRSTQSLVTTTNSTTKFHTNLTHPTSHKQPPLKSANQQAMPSVSGSSSELSPATIATTSHSSSGKSHTSTSANQQALPSVSCSSSEPSLATTAVISHSSSGKPPTSTSTSCPSLSATTTANSANVVIDLTGMSEDPTPSIPSSSSEPSVTCMTASDSCEMEVVCDKTPCVNTEKVVSRTASLTGAKQEKNEAPLQRGATGKRKKKKSKPRNSEDANKLALAMESSRNVQTTGASTDVSVPSSEIGKHATQLGTLSEVHTSASVGAVAVNTTPASVSTAVSSNVAPPCVPSSSIPATAAQLQTAPQMYGDTTQAHAVEEQRKTMTSTSIIGLLKAITPLLPYISSTSHLTSTVASVSKIIASSAATTSCSVSGTTSTAIVTATSAGEFVPEHSGAHKLVPSFTTTTTKPTSSLSVTVTSAKDPALLAVSAPIISTQPSTTSATAASATSTQLSTKSATVASVTSVPAASASSAQPSATSAPAASATSTRPSTKAAPTASAISTRPSTKAAPTASATSTRPSTKAAPTASATSTRPSTKAAPTASATSTRPSTKAAPTASATSTRPSTKAAPTASATSTRPSTTSSTVASVTSTRPSTTSAPTASATSTRPSTTSSTVASVTSTRPSTTSAPAASATSTWPSVDSIAAPSTLAPVTSATACDPKLPITQKSPSTSHPQTTPQSTPVTNSLAVLTPTSYSAPSSTVPVSTIAPVTATACSPSNTATQAVATKHTMPQQLQSGVAFGSTTTPQVPSVSTVSPLSAMTQQPPRLTHPPPAVHLPSASSSLSCSEPPIHHLYQEHMLPVVKLQASKSKSGLLIKWTLSPEDLSWQSFVDRYSLYAFVSHRTAEIPDVCLWGKVGEIKPLALPMAVTLTNFAVGQRYAFAVRVKYVSGLSSRYSNPCIIDI